MERRVALLQNWLLQRLIQNDRRVDARIGCCVRLIHESKGLVSIRELASVVGLSSRQLLRKFEDETGLSPKEFSRIVRFLNALNLLKRHPRQSLTEVSYACGYYDQSHFIHDCEQYSGFAPGEFVRNGKQISY